jgi:hypothetical protein
MSRVVLLKTDARVVGTRREIDLLQPDGIVGKTIFLKPNYNTADPAPAATDTQLLALIQELQNAKAGQLTIGDRSGMANTREAMTSRQGCFIVRNRKLHTRFSRPAFLNFLDLLNEGLRLPGISWSQ